MSDITLYKGDCLVEMNKIADKSVDMILCDLPYEIVNQKWDKIIPFDKLWEQYKRIITDKGAIVLFGQEPFSSKLRCSNLEWYRYDWIWDKTHCSNFQVMNYQCGRQHELISIFSKGKACYTSNNNSMNYYPQKTKRDKPSRNGGGLNTCKMLHGNNMQKIDKIYTEKNPTSIIQFKVVPPKERLHPTQKPIALLEYLIKTYTNENEIVLDNCMGSGSTAIACLNTNRNFIGIEKDDNYFEIAEKRINNYKEDIFNV